MMRITFITTLFLTLIYYVTNAQEKEYFQQEVNYDIQVSLDDISHELNGFISIEYKNNSPDTLKNIFMHLWPNGYSNKETALAKQLLESGRTNFHFTEEKDLGYIVDLEFKVDDKEVLHIPDKEHSDITKLILNTPLNPGAQLIIQTPFKVKIPKLFSRLGHVDQHYNICQWFPKPAVYDQDGWHPMPYLENGEYYAEFGTFDVEISVPGDYVVAATGVLQNTEEKKWLEERIKFTEHYLKTHSDPAFDSKRDYKIFLYNYIDTFSFPAAKQTVKTLHFKQNNIHDFAWFASKDFLVLKDTVQTNNDKKVDAWSYFYRKHNRGYWEHTPEYIKEAILEFSSLIGNYPYDHCTVVEGLPGAGSGMEYPMITVIENIYSSSYLEAVIAHEVAHNWWQGILASNERDAPWIDEGFASYYEKRYFRNKERHLKNTLKNFSESSVAKLFGVRDKKADDEDKYLILHQQRLNEHQKICRHSNKFTDDNYYIQVYAKAPILLEFLENYLGQDHFDIMMRSFYQKFQNTHINANTLQSFFEAYSNADLSWFFDDLICSKEKLDYALKKIEKTENGHLVKIKNKGGTSTPIPVSVYKDGVLVSERWVKPIEGGTTETVLIPEDEIDQVIIDDQNLLIDYNQNNNSIKTSGLKKIEKLRLQWLASLEDPKKSQLFWTPVIAGNKYDKWMLGMAFYNRVFPAKNIEWSAIPMYAFGSKNFNWISDFTYYQNTKKERLKTITYGLSSKSFTQSLQGEKYYRIQPYFSFLFKPKDEKSKISHQLDARHVQIYEELYVTNIVDSVTTQTNKEVNRLCVNELKYHFKNDRSIFPYSAIGTYQFNKDFGKLALESSVRFNLGKTGKFLTTRFFLGTFLYRSEDFKFRGDVRNFNAASVTGGNDYLKDHYYLGRYENEGFTSNQVIKSDGQLKSIPHGIIDLGKAGSIITSLNIESELPIPHFPFKIFADIVYHNERKLPPVSNGIDYDLGVMLSLFDGGLEVYIPFLVSNSIKEYNKVNRPKFYQRITFSFDINKLNPHKRIRTMDWEM